MISREFVQKYLDVKEMLEKKIITADRYKATILKLCDKYSVDPALLAKYNMDLEPRKI